MAKSADSSRNRKKSQVRRLVSEIINYVNDDLWERNASRFLPLLSRKDLFKKPKNWHKVFTDQNGHLDIEEIQTKVELKIAIDKAQNALLKQQNREEGYWCAELGADTTLESDYIMFLHYIDRADPVKIQKLAKTILQEQLSDGGWPIYAHGPSNLSATVKAYWALKFAGHTPDEEPMRKARKCIDALGGIHKINSFSKAYLALFGQYSWKGVPVVTPEIMLFPTWFYFNIYEMSSWTRAIVVPLSIIWAKRPHRRPPANARLDELFDSSPKYVSIREAMGEHDRWRRFFLGWDTALRWLEGHGPHWIRVMSLKKAEKWILERIRVSNGLGAIYPGIMNTIIALKALGYPDDNPDLAHEMKQLESLEIDRGDRIEMQPCFSPVWDTAISMIALVESGMRRNHPALVRASHWLISTEVRHGGDWQIKNPSAPIGGWPFEFYNDPYPDVDDTAMALLALRLTDLDGVSHIEREKAYLRGLNWLLSMQCTEGGWASFDLNNTKEILTKIPFADHNAMIDPPTVDITARVLELLGYIGYDKSYPCVERAVEFVKSHQELDGSWYGRWGVNYLYGTWQALRGLSAVGEDMNNPFIRKAVQWLLSVQRPDGGWGETCATYDDPSQKAKGPSTPSQTAWALMGLLAAGYLDHPAIDKGVHYLLSAQRSDGTWPESEFTGTGFPKVFYLEYTLYRDYFPLMALGVYRRLVKSQHRASRPHHWDGTSPKTMLSKGALS